MAYGLITTKFMEDLLKQTSLAQLAKDVDSYRKSVNTTLISEAAGIFVVAKTKYHMSIEEYSPHSELKKETTAYNVSELTTDMDGLLVSVKGKVSEIYDTKAFKKKDGTMGQFTIIKLGDLTTESITFVKFWGKRKEDLVEFFNIGDALLLEDFRVNVFQGYANLNHQRRSKINHLEDVS